MNAHRRHTLAVAAVGLLLVLAPAISTACPTCYGSPGSTTASTPITDGANNAIIFMLIVIGLVQAGFVSLFWTFWRRAKALRQRREQFRVIPGGAF